MMDFSFPPVVALDLADLYAGSQALFHQCRSEVGNLGSRIGGCLDWYKFMCCHAASLPDYRRHRKMLARCALSRYPAVGCLPARCPANVPSCKGPLAGRSAVESHTSILLRG